MVWTPEMAKIKLNCEFLENSFDHISENTTKRTILQTVARVYDPMGLFQPFTMMMKILLQKICTAGLDWDETLPEEMGALERSELKLLQNFSISRTYFVSNEKYDANLHVFAVACPKAYGVVEYF
ncbi:integrase catalytic domain-containing protein [Trichonephila clavipes]|nr:integrase catalytic domain-containing protein [Trichonephila clavipes]